MRPLDRLSLLPLPLFLLLVLSGPATALELAPFKDGLFAYPGLLRSDAGGNYIVVDYDEMRDINGRDQVPERRVWDRYVSLKVRRERRELAVDTPAGALKHFAVGRLPIRRGELH